MGRTSSALPSLTLCLYYIMVGRACQGIFEDFFRGSSNLVLGSISHRKDCAHPLGVPLLGSCGRPSEGLGFASPPDMIIISYLSENVNTFFLVNFGKLIYQILARRLASVHEEHTYARKRSADCATPKPTIPHKESGSEAETRNRHSESTKNLFHNFRPLSLDYKHYIIIS